jgi:LPS-assembly lipoprotein
MARDAVGRQGPDATRRGWLRGAAGLLALCAGGCGFRPLYGDAGPASGDPAIAAELAAVRVGIIENRFGQLLRRSLQQRLGTGAGGTTPAARWELAAVPTLSTEALGFQRDGQPTRVRVIATANWSLQRLTPREVVANGFERVIDAFNIEPNQYFAADLSRDATERRIAMALADELVTRLAVRMRGLREGSGPRLIEPVEPPPTLPDATVPAAPGGAFIPAPGGGLEGGIGGGSMSPIR